MQLQTPVCYTVIRKYVDDAEDGTRLQLARFQLFEDHQHANTAVTFQLVFSPSLVTC